MNGLCVKEFEKIIADIMQAKYRHAAHRLIFMVKLVYYLYPVTHRN